MDFIFQVILRAEQNELLVVKVDGKVNFEPTKKLLKSVGR